MLFQTIVVLVCGIIIGASITILFGIGSNKSNTNNEEE